LHIILQSESYILLASGIFCDICIVAKRFVLEQKLVLTAYKKSYARNQLVPKWMTLTVA